MSMVDEIESLLDGAKPREHGCLGGPAYCRECLDFMDRHKAMEKSAPSSLRYLLDRVHSFEAAATQLLASDGQDVLIRNDAVRKLRQLMEEGK